MMDTIKSLSNPQTTKILKTAIEGIVLQPCYEQDNPDPANGQKVSTPNAAIHPDGQRNGSADGLIRNPTTPSTVQQH